MMARLRSLVVLMLITGSGAAAVVACGDDPVTPAPAVADAAPAADAGETIAADAEPATAPAIAVFAGTVAKLQATVDASSTFVWTMLAVPGTSDLGTASLVDVTTATPSFVPDRVGNYTISLDVTTGGVVATTLYTVNAVDPAVFYFRTDDDGGALSTATVTVVGALEGDGGVPVSCFARDAGSYANEVSGVAQRSTDVWEAPPGQPSRIVYAIETREDGGTHTSLLASTSASTCATSPVTLDELGVLQGSTRDVSVTSRSIEQPAISPSGNRVAYLRTVPAGTTVATVGFDGANRRDVAPFYAYADGGAAPTVSTPTTTASTTRPVWLDEGTIAWAETVGTGWQLVTAADAAGAAPLLRMKCTGNIPDQVATLPGGDVLASFRVGTNDQTRQLVRYAIDVATQTCTRPQILSTAIPVAFSLSPDGTKIAFGTASTASSTTLNVIQADGGALSAVSPLMSGFSPARWVGAGALLSWAAPPSIFDAGAPTSVSVVAVAQLDGGNLHQVTVPTGASSISTAGSGFCAMGRSYGSGVTFFGALGVAGLRLARRRKKNARRTIG